ncbi:hypothetical protein ACH4KN_27095 [Streptomyces sp. NPDC017546]|uniref:hypothetical protein n=1 Tax=Streptomyces sp. NPDC017546 TaxID=3365001 RepID=UPI00378C7260
MMIAVIADNGALVALQRRYGFTGVGRLSGVGHEQDRCIGTLLMQGTLGRAAAGTAGLNQ